MSATSIKTTKGVIPETQTKKQEFEKCYIVWNGAEYKEPEYHAYPVEVWAKDRNTAKMDAWGEIYDAEYIDLKARRASWNDRIKTKYGYESRESIERDEEQKQWRLVMSRFVERNPNKEVLIWSGEHGAFWRPKRSGYTKYEADAGVYSASDAWDAVSHCGIKKRITFIEVDSRKRIGI